MRIGILPTVDPSSGGIYQYGLTILQGLDQRCGESGDNQFVLFTDDSPSPAMFAVTRRHGWTIKPTRRPTVSSQALKTLGRVVGEGPHRQAWRRIRSTRAHSIGRQPGPPTPMSCGICPRPTSGSKTVALG